MHELRHMGTMLFAMEANMGFKNDTGNVLGSILQPPGFQLQLNMSSCSSRRKQRPNMYRAGARGGGKPCTGDWPQHVPFSSGSASHTVGNEETVITSMKFISESGFQRVSMLRQVSGWWTTPQHLVNTSTSTIQSKDLPSQHTGTSYGPESSVNGGQSLLFSGEPGHGFHQSGYPY